MYIYIVFVCGYIHRHRQIHRKTDRHKHTHTHTHTHIYIYIYISGGGPTLERPCVGAHKRPKFMSSCLLLQQCTAGHVRLIWIVGEMGGKWFTADNLCAASSRICSKEHVHSCVAIYRIGTFELLESALVYKMPISAIVICGYWFAG